MGAFRSPDPNVNVFDQLPSSGTVAAKYWCDGNGVEPDDPSASATAAKASSTPAPQSLSLPAGPASNAVPSIAVRPSACVHVGWSWRSRSATPATYGVAIDEPLFTL